MNGPFSTSGILDRAVANDTDGRKSFKTFVGAVPANYLNRYVRQYDTRFPCICDSLSNVEYWLPLMLFGYIVVVPVVGMLVDTDSTSESADAGEQTGQSQVVGDRYNFEDTALATLRDRYARGDLTGAQFERKVERLLETDTLETSRSSTATAVGTE